jgi:hypothetical protein
VSAVEFVSLVDVNVRGTANILRHFAPTMIEDCQFGSTSEKLVKRGFCADQLIRRTGGFLRITSQPTTASVTGLLQ